MNIVELAKKTSDKAAAAPAPAPAANTSRFAANLSAVGGQMGKGFDRQKFDHHANTIFGARPLGTQPKERSWSQYMGGQDAYGQSNKAGPKYQNAQQLGQQTAANTYDGPATGRGLTDLPLIAGSAAKWVGNKVAPKVTAQVASKMPWASLTPAVNKGVASVASRASGKIAPKLLSGAANVGGPLATPINAGMEGLDAIGALPEAMGGTGLGNVGWANEIDFRNETSPTSGGYTGKWAPLGYLGAAFNSWSKPVRSTTNLLTGAVAAPYQAGKAMWQGSNLDNQWDALNARRQANNQPSYTQQNSGWTAGDVRLPADVRPAGTYQNYPANHPTRWPGQPN
jgi:hypothetical protein